MRGLPQQASLLTSTSPAVDGDIVVVPYPSGDLMALKVSDGTPVWSENLSRTRQTSQLASMSDAARPAIDGGTVFAVGHAGRMVATQTKTGERLWSINVPGTQTPWVAGDTVYVVDTRGQVMALARTDGKTRWTAQLPDSKTWSGPVLAGGELWLTSNKGQLVAVDAATGKVGGQVNLGEAGLYSASRGARPHVRADGFGETHRAELRNALDLSALRAAPFRGPRRFMDALMSPCHVAKGPPSVAIVGRPNVGKSTLLQPADRQPRRACLRLAGPDARPARRRR